MSDPLESYFGYRTPTPTRPLLGLTILLVEDSRFSSEAIRLMCLRSGARIRRADSLKAARRHLAAYRPAVVIVDVGLPDGSGIDLIKELAGSQTPVEVLLATSGDDSKATEAMAAGAQAFLTKPLGTLGAFQETILLLLPEEARPRGPRVLSDEVMTPDPLAFQDDMAHIADLMTSDAEPATLDYIAQFLSGLAMSAKDAVLADATQALAKSRATGDPVNGPLTRLRAIVTARIQDRAAI